MRTVPEVKSTDVTRPLWLFLRKEGGRWRANELAKQCALEVTAARAALKAMKDRVQVKRVVDDNHGRAYLYEVDDDCYVPCGIRVKEVLPW